MVKLLDLLESLCLEAGAPVVWRLNGEQEIVESGHSHCVFVQVFKLVGARAAGFDSCGSVQERWKNGERKLQRKPQDYM